ncbi:hypothetical protein K439DRAFT_1345526, partial [Ramaria rubella]
KAASDVAVMEVPPTHLIRLDLALNFSVFYHKILNSPDRYAFAFLYLFCPNTVHRAATLPSKHSTMPSPSWAAMTA